MKERETPQQRRQMHIHGGTPGGYLASTGSMGGFVVLGLSGLMFVASGGLLAYFYLAGGTSTSIGTAQAAESAGEARAASDRGQTAPISHASQTSSINLAGTTAELVVDGAVISVPWSEFGIDSSNNVDRAKATKALRALKTARDKAPLSARMDLRAHKIFPEQAGRAIDLYGALSVIEQAANQGTARIELPVVEIPAEVTVADLGIDDISHVVASFETRFSVGEKARNYNLKLAASHLDGYVLKPGELFSFNEVVGARTEKEGYKIAHVILGGEMVDGQAGGTCQISTTLHGASFFAGLEIVKSRPHSRPSTYVAMGLDATVVYPVTDLKLRNTYDFPVVISFQVARGRSRVEILGKERPYDKVTFEREVVKRIEFDTVARDDARIPIGSMLVDQLGFPGYDVNRYRKFYRKGKLLKTDKWKLRYRPVTEYVRVGANPDPNLPPPKFHKPHGPKPPGSGTFRMSQ